jgi:hypothetical protein
MQVTDQHGQWNIGRGYSSHSQNQSHIQVHGISTDNSVFGPLMVASGKFVPVASTTSFYLKVAAAVVHWVSSDNIAGLLVHCAAGNLPEVPRYSLRRPSEAPLCNNVECSDNPSCCRQESETGQLTCCNCCLSTWEQCSSNHQCERVGGLSFSFVTNSSVPSIHERKQITIQ